jgi:hypothetical protein
MASPMAWGEAEISHSPFLVAMFCFTHRRENMNVKKNLKIWDHVRGNMDEPNRAANNSSISFFMTETILSEANARVSTF